MLSMSRNLEVFFHDYCLLEEGVLYYMVDSLHWNPIKVRVGLHYFQQGSIISATAQVGSCISCSTNCVFSPTVDGCSKMSPTVENRSHYLNPISKAFEVLFFCKLWSWLLATE